MDQLVSELLAMAICIAFSAYFSASETAFSSLNRARMKAMAEQGNKRAERALALAEQYDRLLSTLLIGNNIVNIAVASIGTVLFVRYYGDLGATISTVVITVVVLIFGEISPKSLAKDSPERFAMMSAPLLRVLMWVLAPLNFLFSQWKKLRTVVFRVKDDRKLTQQELLVLVDEVEQEGGIDSDEGELLRSAIEFPDQEAEEILTHRVDLEAVQADASREEVAKVFRESRYSRLLVYGEDLDDVLGVVHLKDFCDASEGTALRDIMTAPLFVPPTVKISALLRQLQRSKSHVAVVSDEFGGTLGIVTMEDILEELVGEIWDEHDEVEEPVRQVAEGVYRISCAENPDVLKELFHADAGDDNATLGGWVAEQLGRIPVQGDTFLWEELKVTVTKTDGRRVLEVEVRKMDEMVEAGA